METWWKIAKQKFGWRPGHQVSIVTKHQPHLNHPLHGTTLTTSTHLHQFLHGIVFKVQTTTDQIHHLSIHETHSPTNFPIRESPFHTNTYTQIHETHSLPHLPIHESPTRDHIVPVRLPRRREGRRHHSLNHGGSRRIEAAKTIISAANGWLKTFRISFSFNFFYFFLKKRGRTDGKKEKGIVFEEE